MDITKEGVILNVDAATISGAQEVSSDWYSPYRVQPDAGIRTHYIARAMNRYLHITQPDVVAIETPFVNMRMVNSFIVLQEHFKQLSITINKHSLPMFPFSPLTIKASVGASGIKGKSVMTDRVLSIDEIVGNMSTHPTEMSEHAIDAICACYTFLTKSRGGLL